MRVLVTGGAGFIGSHIVDQLLEAGHTTRVLDDLSSGKAKNVPSGAEVIQGDVRDAGCVDHVLREFQPEAICHQAAQVNASFSMQAPAADGEINVLGSLRLIEGAARYQVSHFVFASSAAVYLSSADVPYGESHMTIPATYYGVSKLAAEHYLQVAAATTSMRCVCLRYANVYGPRQNTLGEGGVVANFIERALSNQPLSVYGDGSQTRDFVYVEDVARANVLALDASGGTFNISTGIEHSISDLFEGIQAASARELVRQQLPVRVGDVQTSALSPERAKKVLGWVPQTSLGEGLKVTWEALSSGRRC